MASLSHIATNSPCRNAGAGGFAVATDIDGEAWANPPSVGCDEINIGAITGGLTVSPQASFTNVAVGFEIQFRASIDGRLTRSSWNFGDGAIITNRAVVNRSFATPGTYQVVLTGFNETFPAGISGTVTVQVAAQTVHYVRTINAGAAAPFTSWETAATNIQNAINAATQVGALVLVSNGTYNSGGTVKHGAMTNRVAIDKMLTVRSVNGPAFTTIAGAGPLGNAAVRGAWVGNDALLSGFTITGGHTLTNGASLIDSDRLRSGGGAWCEPFAKISNCVFTGNSAHQRGGGAMHGFLYNCVFTNNTSVQFGGGVAEAVVQDSLIVRNNASNGGGSYVGELNRCRFIGNVATSFGGGANLSTLNNCVLLENTASGGGGAYDSTLNGCALYRNASDNRGGGADGSRLRNCTVVGNTTSGEGGGTYNCSHTNTIVYFNNGAIGMNWTGNSSAFQNSCTTPTAPGLGNITTEPKLASLTHLSSESPCVGAGNAAIVSGVDIDGENWATPPAMGCDEINIGAITGAITVAFRISSTNMGVGGVLDVRADIEGRLTRSVWNFGDGTVVSNQPFRLHSYSSTGFFPVVLTAFNESFPAGVSATVVVQVAAQAIHYVNISNATPAAPYTSWVTAATNIQQAIDASTQIGALILVTNGNYNTGGRVVSVVTNRVAVNKAVIVRSVNGPQQTFITGGGGIGATAVRSVYVGTNAMLSGFTLSGGRTHNSLGNYYLDYSGAGAFSEASGVISNCTISGNTAYANAGGVFGGTVRNSTIANNSCQQDSGGGAFASTLYSCTILSNSAISTFSSQGGGAAQSRLHDCFVAANFSANAGGGASASELFNCTLTTNGAPWGGGVFNSILTNCVVSGNAAFGGASQRGGGLMNSTAYNSTIISNVAPEGGGIYSGTLYNCLVQANRATAGSGGGTHTVDNYFCTLINNTASALGGGAFGTENDESLLYNCLLVGNTAANGGGACDVEMYNCTLFGNSATTSGGGLYVTMFGWAPIYNCIIYSNNAPTNTNWFTESVDFIYFTCTTPQPSAPSNITNYPQFVNSAATNLRLLATSPCINAGYNDQVTFVVDLDGNPRISGINVDIGAYEFQESVGDADTDGDGIPDWWETLYFGGATNANPNAPASNGVNTVLEAWISDLNPTNPTSKFQFVAMTNLPAGLTTLVASPSSTARIYQAYFNTNLLTVPQEWQLYGNTKTGTGAGVFFIVTNELPQRSYRTGVRLP